MKLLTFAFCFTLFASCSQTDDMEELPVPVGFIPTIEAQTRGTDYNKDNLPSLGVLAYFTQGSGFNAASSTPNFMYNQIVTRGSGSWEYTPTKYWPANSNDKLTFFAYAPHNATGLTLPGSTDAGYPSFTYQVQATEAAQADLLLAKPVPDKTASNGTVNFSFKHALTRVVLNVEAGSGFTGVSINSLSIQTKKSGTVAFRSVTSPTDWMQWSNIASGAGNDISCTATLPSSSNTITAGTTRKIATFFLLPVAAAGVTSESATLSFTYTMNGVGDTRTVTDLALPSMTDWLPSTSIAYNLKISRDAVTIAISSIGVWNSGSSQDLDGTLDKVSAIEGYRAEDLKIGDYYYDDGTTSDGGYRIMEDGTTFQYETVPDATKTCIGFVFAVGHSQYDLSDYSTTGIGQQKCKAYVIALENAGPQCQWGPSGGSAPTIGCYPSQDNHTYPEKDWSGYVYTGKISDYAINHYAGLKPTGDNGFPATYYTKVDYASRVTVPVTSSGWFFPAIGQIYEAWTQKHLLHDIVPVTGRFWSSSESTRSKNWWAVMLDVSDSPSEGRVLGNNKYNNYSGICIRSVLAF